MATEEMGGYNHNVLRVQGVRIPPCTTINETSFNTEYWPKIESAINVILTKQPGESFQLSCEDLFSIVYKCTIQQFSEKMFARLTSIVDTYTTYCIVNFTQVSGQEYLEKFSFFLAQFFNAVCGISSIFSYMDKNYVVQTFGKNMSTMLYCQLSQKIVIQSRVFDILRQISDGECFVDPKIVMDTVKGLYSLNEEFARFNMKLFARFIPNLEPPSCTDNYTRVNCDVMEEEFNENFSLERLKNKRKADEFSEENDGSQKRIAKSS